MSAVPDQWINLEVCYPTCLVEKSEKLDAIFHNNDGFQYFIQILDADNDGFKGCFAVYPQVNKADNQGEDTLRADPHITEAFLVEQPNVDPEPYGTVGATTNTTTATTTSTMASTNTTWTRPNTITALAHEGATNSPPPPNATNLTTSTHNPTCDPAAVSRSNSGTVTSPM